jgi:hypothetical protein
VYRNRTCAPPLPDLAGLSASVCVWPVYLWPVLCLPGWFRGDTSPEAALYPVEAERGVEVEFVAGLQAEEVGDEPRFALDQAKAAAELLS